MDADTIALVQQAWEAAEWACKPPQVCAVDDGFQVAWECCDHGWAAIWHPVGERTMPAVAALIDASLHRYLLSQGAWVVELGDPAYGYAVLRHTYEDEELEDENPETDTVIVASTRGSLTAAMARGVLALKGGGNGEV